MVFISKNCFSYEKVRLTWASEQVQDGREEETKWYEIIVLSIGLCLQGILIVDDFRENPSEILSKTFFNSTCFNEFHCKYFFTAINTGWKSLKMCKMIKYNWDVVKCVDWNCNRECENVKEEFWILSIHSMQFYFIVAISW